MKQESPSQDAIAEHAYYLWEQAGRPSGRDRTFWLRAEQELTPHTNLGGANVMALLSSAGLPPPASASAVHEVPPAIKHAVKTTGHLASRRRRSKRV